MKTNLLLLTLNEIEGVKAVMPRIKRGWLDEIVFIDGNSTDGTVEYIKEHGYRLVLEDKPGARHAVVKAVKEIDSDVIITFSPDGNCIPEIIPSLIEKMKEGYDMVIVSRYAKGAKSDDDNMITAFGNRMFTALINILYGGAYTDVMGIYRAYKKDLITSLDLDKDVTYSLPEKVFRTKIGLEPILSARAAKRKLRIAEIPGDEPARIGGKSKLKVLRWGGAYLLQIIREIFFWR